MLSLHNQRQPRLSPLVVHQRDQHVQLTMRPYVGEPQPSVSIVAEIDDTRVVIFDSARDVLAALSLEREETHRIRLSLIEDPSSATACILQFRGVWLSKGAILVPHGSHEHDSRDKSVLNSERDPPNRRKSFDLVTDAEPAAYETKHHKKPDLSRTKLSYIMTWDRNLARHTNADFSRLTLGNYSLVGTQEQSQGSHLTTQHLYFRAGPPSTPLFSHAYRFPSDPPDVLILQLGTNDAAHLEATQTLTPPTPSHQINKHLDAITTAYATFIKSIRKSAYPASSPTNNNGTQSCYTHSLWQQDYLYNSAPATLPILILPPLNAPRYFAAALQSLVFDLVTKEGDTALHLIDTKGWFQNADFIAQSSSNATTTILTPQAQKTFATYIRQHLCPYLSTNPEDECSFRRHDIRTGKVYVPVEDELEKVLLESKIRKVNEGLFGIPFGRN